MIAAREAQLQGVDGAERLLNELLEELKLTSKPNKKLDVKSQLKLTAGCDLSITHDFEISAGRAQDNTWVVKLSEASRHHFKIILERESAWLVDLGSRNGTFLNDQCLKSEKHKIVSGDKIAFTADSNPAVFQLVETPVESLNHPVDCFSWLLKSGRFNMFDWSDVLALAKQAKCFNDTGSLLELAAKINQKHYCLLKIPNAISGFDQRFVFADLTSPSLSERLASSHDVSGCYWALGELEPVFQSSLFEASVLKDILSWYERTNG